MSEPIFTRKQMQELMRMPLKERIFLFFVKKHKMTVVDSEGTFESTVKRFKGKTYFLKSEGVS